MKNQKHNAAGICGGSAKSDFDSHFSTPWFTLVHSSCFEVLSFEAPKRQKGIYFTIVR